MLRSTAAETLALESWQDYQEALKRAIAPLTVQQLQRRVMPNLRTPEEIAEHIVFGRALHLHRTLGEKAAELTPLLQWDNTDNPPHHSLRDSGWFGTDLASHHRTNFVPYRSHPGFLLYYEQKCTGLRNLCPEKLPGQSK